MTPQQLKNSILQRAIEGRLVEQRPEEGTARELLKEIRAEKERLIEEGKIKKSKPLPPISDEEKPFDIPEGWEWVRLGDIGNWGSGATPKRHHPEYYGGNIPWLKTGDLNDGYISEIPESITQEGFDNSSVRLNPVGSVLMAMYGATIGKLGIITIPATTNQACCACIPFANLEPKFLFYYLMSQRTNFIRLGEGGAQPNISKEKIVNFVFPLPPLTEQHRIVAKIEALLPLIDQYANAYTKLTDFNTSFPEAMKKSLLQYAIQGKLVEQRADEGTAQDLLKDIQAEKKRLVNEGKIKKAKALPPITEDEIPFDIPENWKWVRLGEIGFLERGSGLKRSEMTDTGKPCIRYGELYTTYHTRFSETVSHTSEEVFESCHKVNHGEIVITYEGQEEIAMGGDMTKWFAHGMNPLYLTYLLNSPYCIACKQVLATGNIIVHISNDKLSSILLPIPPLTEQQRIVAKLEELLPFCDQLRSKQN